MPEPTSATAPAGHAGHAGQQLTAGAAPASWRGVLRHDGHRVWSCRHQHGSTAQARACSEAKVSRLENGKVGVSPRDVRDLLDLYQVTGKPRAAMLRAAQHARWLRRRGGK